MITWDDLIGSIWLGAFLLVVSSLVFLIAFGVVYFGGRRSTIVSRILLRGRRAVLLGLMAGFPLGFTGIVAGFLTGSSRSPAVSALVPAILTFIGLIVIYMIGKARLRAMIAGFTVFVFSANLIVGTVLGSASRDRHQADLASVKVRELKADQEFKVRLYCKGLGLISDLSKPCVPESGPEKAEKP
jgi:hypothetical protein